MYQVLGIRAEDLGTRVEGLGLLTSQPWLLAG